MTFIPLYDILRVEREVIKMKEFFGCLVDWFYIIILVVLLLFLLCISFFAIYLKCSKVEIDRYFINSEITHCDYSNSKQGLGMRDVKYIVAVRNKEFACK